MFDIIFTTESTEDTEEIFSGLCKLLGQNIVEKRHKSRKKSSLVTHDYSKKKGVASRDGARRW